MCNLHTKKKIKNNKKKMTLGNRFSIKFEQGKPANGVDNRKIIFKKKKKYSQKNSRKQLQMNLN